MPPNIIKSHFFAKDIFVAKTIEKSKFTYLDLKTSNKGILKNDEHYGVYFMFFKKHLIYIGKYCGKKSVRDRWEKHLKTNTSRFRPINFLKCKKIEIDKLRVKTISELKNYYKKKKDNLIKKYPNSHFKKTSIYNDIIKEIIEIDFIQEKKYFKTLCSDGSDQSLNRLKVADFFWDELKLRNQNNIFDDYEFVYLKFEKFNKFIPKDIKDRVIKTKFEEFFEGPLIRKYKPGANSDKSKGTSKFILKKYDIATFTNTIIEKLKELYDRQNFFIK